MAPDGEERTAPVPSHEAAAEEESLPRVVPGQDQIPLVIVGASYRDVPTDVRARLAALERTDQAPSVGLRAAGYAHGAVFVETCSRVEWVIATRQPAWAAELLSGALRLRLGENVPLHLKTGPAAIHYLLRVAVGLDSVAEGEPAVGRQVVLAFEKAHGAGDADRVLRRMWRTLQSLLAERRRRGVAHPSVGVQSLAADALLTHGVGTGATVCVYGQGEIGRAVVNTLRLRGYKDLRIHRRDTTAQFMEDARSAQATIVCTGGPAPWVDLPTREGEVPIAVDVGAPQQIRAHPGWKLVALEDLLSHPKRMLSDEDRAWLSQRVRIRAETLVQELCSPPPAVALGMVDETRRVFLHETLPPLLEKLPPALAEEVRKACASFAHALIEKVREGTS